MKTYHPYHIHRTFDGTIPVEICLEVDLDQERGIIPKKDRTANVHRVTMNERNVVDPNAINASLRGQAPFDPPVQEAISEYQSIHRSILYSMLYLREDWISIDFLDHLLRETPAKMHIAQKRLYFGRATSGGRCLLGGGVEAMKGIYQSIRAAQLRSSSDIFRPPSPLIVADRFSKIFQGQHRVVNVDVSNTTFWHETTLSLLTYLLINEGESHDEMYNRMALLPVTATSPAQDSSYFANPRRLQKNEIKVDFRNAGESKSTFSLTHIQSVTSWTGQHANGSPGITTKSIEDMLKPLIQHRCQGFGRGRLPKHIYYFRDGVPEGQYQAVLRNEVADIKVIMAEFGKSNLQYEVLFTVVVAEKRHHIRFFPNHHGPFVDNNGNPVPGTLVERNVTHPFQFEFYLCSYSSIKGTARPNRYHILMDDCRHEQESFLWIIYEHCYHYMRATTPVPICKLNPTPFLTVSSKPSLANKFFC